jgi:nitrogenase molybdenum-iron protein beta chain
MASTSSFTEGASVFGGGSNVKTAVKNVFDIYDPDIIAIHTTCLSETIGDDLNSYIQDMDIPEGKLVVHCNTPSYVGSHLNGFFNMMCGFINYLTRKTGTPNGKTVVFPGFVNPGDMRELKRLAVLMKVPIILFPDTGGVMDAPMTGRFEMYPAGGTTLGEIRELGDCDIVLALGTVTSAEPAELLKKKFKVPYKLLPLPMGVEATDRYIMELSKISKAEVPYELEEQRGQLIDILLDCHQYTYGKTAAVYGDPDTVTGLVAMCLEMGMVPIYAITGTPKEDFTREVNELLERYGVTHCVVKANADLFELHQLIKNEPVDLLIGTSYGKAIAKAENIPLVRAGFPILDRYVHSYLPLVGYTGMIRMAERITNALMDRQDFDCADEDLETVM